MDFEKQITNVLSLKKRFNFINGNTIDIEGLWAYVNKTASALGFATIFVENFKGNKNIPAVIEMTDLLMANHKEYIVIISKSPQTEKAVKTIAAKNINANLINIILKRNEISFFNILLEKYISLYQYDDSYWCQTILMFVNDFTNIDFGKLTSHQFKHTDKFIFGAKSEMVKEFFSNKKKLQG